MYFIVVVSFLFVITNIMCKKNKTAEIIGMNKKEKEETNKLFQLSLFWGSLENRQ
jgi:hypothetical protein